MPNDRGWRTQRLVTTIRQALQKATTSLSELSHSSPELEASVLLSHLLQKPRSYLFAWPDKALSDHEEKSYHSLILRRLQGEPIAHITGVREFWSLALKISPATLIPRPETELLVERTLEIMQTLNQPIVADLGSGSGAIALAIASERPDCTLHATDISHSALKIAQENAQSLKLGNIVFYHGNWFEALPVEQLFDLIVSNPPYIPTQDPHLTQGDLPSEPVLALASGIDGLDAIRLVVSQAGQHLKPGGWLVIEHGYDQGEAVRSLFHQAGFIGIRTVKELAGHERITEGIYV